MGTEKWMNANIAFRIGQYFGVVFRILFEGSDFIVPQTWLQILALPLVKCVTLAYF